MKILVMNCNTTWSMTAAIGAAGKAVASPGTEVVPVQPLWGPESAEGYFDSFVTAAAVLDRLATLKEPYDAVVMAGFGEHGREGARELLDVPVVDVTEAGSHLAMLLGHRYGVVTTLARAVPQIEDSLMTAGLLDGCAAVVAAEMGVLDLERDHDHTVDVLQRKSVEALDRGAEVIVLGCAGMTSIRADLSDRLGVPVIDAVEAAVGLAETLVRLGLTTSKRGAYAAPRPKHRAHWPISAALSLKGDSSS